MQSESLNEMLANTVLTEEQRAKLSPTDILDLLKKGNKDFTEDNLTVRNNTQRVRDAAIGQYPLAVVLSCLDSRVPVEDVFHRGIGDLFVARVAGNIVNDDILGSLEYACKISGAKLILVLGHEYCGAIQSAIDDVKLGNITTLLSKIQPAVKAASEGFKGERSFSNSEFADLVCEHNIKLSINQIRKMSPILREMEEQEQILIVGSMYDMKTGEVHFLKDNR
ncbi:carbonic anhydrase family protein [uncultured Bacteroides sp.]|uniref:carbonic anhydrase family protein n=1 Tax=uncultured Bacteroides sp. TaxID=162156 RepID=UPI002AA65B17|nr:carbonic anhydrase family protein [uncultured Bacteroides sp.]